MNVHQLAIAAAADRKWLINSAAILGRPLRYRVSEARWWGLVRHLTETLALPLRAAARIATESLRGSGAAVKADPANAIVLTVDLDRYGSVFLGNLSRALVHETPKRRGRPARPRHGRDAIAAAQKYGVDIGLVQSALERTPAERLAMAEANAQFLRDLRRKAS